MTLTNIALDYVRTWTALTLLGLDDMDSEQACSAYRVIGVMGSSPYPAELMEKQGMCE